MRHRVLRGYAMNTPTRYRRLATRRGAAMMMALVVLLVVGLISGLSLRAILQSHRQTRAEQQRVQAEILADAALSRAISMLQKDPAWKGENWTSSLVSPATETADTKAATTDPKFTGVAETKVETLAGQPHAWKISVVSIYPSDPVHRAQARRETTYSTSQGGEKP